MERVRQRDTDEDEEVRVSEHRLFHVLLLQSGADRLYGVTMPERGVSQLVSVDLTQAEKLVA